MPTLLRAKPTLGFSGTTSRSALRCEWDGPGSAPGVSNVPNPLPARMLTGSDGVVLSPDTSSQLWPDRNRFLPSVCSDASALVQLPVGAFRQASPRGTADSPLASHKESPPSCTRQPQR